MNDIDSSFREAQAQYSAMKAAEDDIKYLEDRWRLLPSEEQMAGLVLEDLLAAQDRRAVAEVGFASAQVEYNMAIANLNRATGILVQCLPESQANESKPQLQNGPEESPPMPPGGMENVPPPPPDVTSLKSAPITRIPAVSAYPPQPPLTSSLPRPPVK